MDLPSDWPFDQAPNVAAITTKQVIENKLPIPQVIHYEDDHSWAFTCGSPFSTENGRLVGMGEILKIDPSLVEISNLPPGWGASRKNSTSAWERFKEE